MTNVKIIKGRYPNVFGGIGFHNNEAMLYPLIEKDHFEQYICKCYREIAPGFMRTFGGYDDWTKEHMDAFAEYYHKMQAVTDTPIYLAGAKGKVHFSDEDRKLYCERVADNLLYLKKEKGVKHLRYFCYSNEMSCGTWGDLMKELPTFKKYHEFLHSAFQNRLLDIGLLATDASEYDNWKTVDWAMENMPRITEDYTVHIYERAHDIYNLEFYDFFYEKCNELCKKAIINDGRRVHMSEFGLQKNESTHLQFGNNVVIDVCRYYWDDFERAYCALMLAEMVFCAINAGVFTMAFWSFTDYPDPYFCAYSTGDEYSRKWGMCERFVSGTTDSKYNKHGVMRWEDDGDYSAKEFYWCLAPLMKLFKKNTKVLDIETDDKLLRSCGIMNRNGSVSIGIVNRNKEETEIKLDSSLFRKKIRVYEYDPRNVPMNKFSDIQDYTVLLDENNPVYTLKAESVTFFTTDYEEKAESVYAEDVTVSGNILSWTEVSDKNHVYYRVYASDTEDFTPSKENQIASTVGTDIKISDNSLFYKVLSVDKYGNV